MTNDLTSIPAEMSVLGALLLGEPKAQAKVMPMLRPADFSDRRHEYVFASLAALYERGEGVDAVTLEGELRRQGNYEAAGGLLYIMELGDYTPTTAHIEQYAATVREKSRMRTLYGTLKFLGRRTLEEDATFEEMSELMTQATLNLSAAATEEEIQPLSTGFAKLLSGRGQGGGAYMFGLRSLDAPIKMRPGGFSVIGAPTGHGKTVLACMASEYSLEKRGATVFYHSCEMGVDEIAARRVMARTGIGYDDIEQGTLTDGQIEQLMSAADEVKDMPFFVLPRSISVMRARSICARWRMENPGKPLLYVVDHLQICNLGGNRRFERRDLEMGAIAELCKDIAQELGVHVIGLTQLNSQGGARDSAEIEHMADLFYTTERTGEPENGFYPSEGFIAKQRGGLSGIKIPLLLHGTAAKFVEPAPDNLLPPGGSYTSSDGTEW